MKSSVSIVPIKGIQIHLLQVPEADGTIKELHLAEINGVLLVSLSDLCKYFKESRSTLHAHFATGQLHRYHANGRRKLDAGIRKVFVDFRAWLQLDKSHGKKSKRMPKKFKLVLRTGSYTHSQGGI